MIIGAGLGGLMLAILLEKINAPYTIYERANKVKPLGSILSLNANVLPVFEQLEMLEDIKKISLTCSWMDLFDADLKKIATMRTKKYEAVAGYPALVFARPDLYNLLLAKVPAEKMVMGKKVIALEQSESGAMIRCSDGSTYHGDILVGADGAYSAVRQSLYKHMEKKKELPKSDSENLALGYISMVGTTGSLDPLKYPQLKDPECHFAQVIDGTSRHWTCITIPNNKMCWGVGIQLESATASRDQQFRNSEWGPESIDAMVKEFHGSVCPLGGTMGDLIDATDKDTISKVYLEEKFFETWHSGRTVLIGDGANNALQDAVILANCIYEMKSVTAASINDVFKDYYEQRSPEAKYQFEYSKFIAKLVAGQNWKEKLLRKVVFGCLPEWVQTKGYANSASYRPQATFLPMVEKRGTGYVRPQKLSERYAKEQEMVKAKAQAEPENGATIV
ncbi:hypothetical protein BG011_003130 [Mortierella polycephala]|uniref:FAD-binding domain-containing protein n=1 Tax=Mortierella polycephala TaxID=41804 RepID=A0A9P6QGK0_9FUNG|nr:hypothetical protein BG011_003130 [Mortierella polycephala]